MQYKILVPGINTRYYVPWKYYILCIFFFLYVNNTLFFTLTRLGSRLMTIFLFVRKEYSVVLHINSSRLTTHDLLIFSSIHI